MELNCKTSSCIASVINLRCCSESETPTCHHLHCLKTIIQSHIHGGREEKEALFLPLSTAYVKTIGSSCLCSHVTLLYSSSVSHTTERARDPAVTHCPTEETHTETVTQRDQSPLCLRSSGQLKSCGIYNEEGSPSSPLLFVLLPLFTNSVMVYHWALTAVVP